MARDKSSAPREKSVAFVVARLSSSRFPAKHFQPIGEKPLLKHITDELKLSSELDEIVLTTVEEEANIPLKEFARKEAIGCFWYRGEIDHVTTRLAQAAKSRDASICILISGDCPLVYAPLIDNLIRIFRAAPEKDVLEIGPPPPATISAIQGVCIARRKAWELADELSDAPELKEHHFPVLSLKREYFHHLVLPHPEEYFGHDLRLSIDTYADLVFFRRVAQALKTSNESLRLPNVLKLLKRQPKIQQHNKHVHQRGLLEKPRKIIYFIDSGAPHGYGHLMRSLEIALQITERLSWPVTLVIDDENALDKITSRGFICLWGAFERKGRNVTTSLTKNYTHQILADYDAVIFDIAERNVPLTWCGNFPEDIKKIVIDKSTEWTNKADAVFIPGVTGNLSDLNTQQVQPEKKLFWGKDYIVVRREIADELSSSHHKSIDLLHYASTTGQVDMLTELQQENPTIRMQSVDGNNSDFPKLLSKAHIYVAHFGYSFYEALYLGTIPVCLPTNEKSRYDAEKFYKAFKLPPLFVEKKLDIEEILYALEDIKAVLVNEQLGDGTPNIVDRFKELLLA